MTIHEFPLGESFRSAALSVRDCWNMPEVVVTYLSGRDPVARRSAYDVANAECWRLAGALLEAAREGRDASDLVRAHHAARAARAAAVAAVFNEPFTDALEYVLDHERECMEAVAAARAA